MKTLIVLNFFSRPENFVRVVEAWHKQETAHQFDIVVVDNNKDRTFTLPSGNYDVWRWDRNAGCPCKIYPALSYSPREYKYTLFADDDILPASTCIQLFIDDAVRLNNRFATIGVFGRNFNIKQPNGKRYQYGNVQRDFKPVQVDLTVRMHLVLTSLLPYVLTFRNRLTTTDEGNRLAQIHDDFLLCMGIQQETGECSYLATGYQMNTYIYRDLDDAKAIWRKPEHLRERNTMVDLSMACGWTSCRSD